MKSCRKCITMLLLMLAGGPAFAQNGLGVLGGFNVTNLIQDPTPPGLAHGSRTRFTAGVFADFDLFGKLGLQIEPGFVQKGANKDVTDQQTFEYSRLRVDLSYLELPLLVKLKLMSSQTGPYLLAGPSFGVLLAAKEGNRTGTADIKDQRKSYDVGLTGGAGLFLAAHKARLFVEVKYNYGLMDINDDAGDTSTLHSNGVRVQLGVYFPRK